MNESCDDVGELDPARLTLPLCAGNEEQSGCRLQRLSAPLPTRFRGIEQLTDEELAALREKDSARARKIAAALDAAEEAEDRAQDRADAAERAA